MADEVLGKLKVLLGADATELTSSVDGATEMLKKFAEVAAAAAGPAALGELLKSSIENIDAMYHLGQTVGGTVEDLQILEQAGRLAGVSAETMATSLEQLNRHLGDASINGGAVAETLQRIGLNSKDLLALPLQDRFMKVADAINQYGDAAVRTQLAQELLGRGGIQMVGALSEIRDKAEEAKANLEKFGAIVSQTDASRIVEADDAMKNLSLATQGLGNALAVQFAPAIKKAADELGDMISKEGLFKTISEDALATVLTVTGLLGDSWHGLTLIMAEIIAKADQMVVSFDNLKGRFSEAARKDAIAAQGVYLQAMADVDKILAEPLPSDSIKRWYASVNAAVADAKKETGSLSLPPPTATQDDASKKQLDQEQKKLDQLRNSLINQAQLEDESYKKRLSALDKYNADGLLSDEETDQLKQNALTQHQEKLSDLIKQGQADQNSFYQLSYGQQAATIFGELQNITDGVAQHNRALFEINKVSGIANAIINAYTGISKTLASYPFPINIGLAAAHAAVAFAQVSAIQSTSYTGGGGTAPALTAATPATPVSDVGDGNSTTTAAPRQVGINISGISPGSLYSGQQVRDLITAINNEISDGAVLNVGFS